MNEEENQEEEREKRPKSRADRRLDGTLYFDTRRVADRRFRMKPCQETKNIIGYTLAIAQELYGVELHAFVAMPNRTGDLTTDMKGNFSQFKQFLNSRITLCLNELHDVKGQMWEQRERRKTEKSLLNAEETMLKLRQTVLEPVKANLVSDWRDWRTFAFLFGPEEWGKKLTFKRPSVYYADSMPEELSFTPVSPRNLSEKEVKRLILEINREAEEYAKGETFLGMKRFKRGVTPFDVPSDEEKYWNWEEGAMLRRARKRASGRRVARYCGTGAEIKSAETEEVEFRLAVDVAMEKFQAGKRDVEFPDGTDFMRRFNVRIESPKPSILRQCPRGP